MLSGCSWKSCFFLSSDMTVEALCVMGAAALGWHTVYKHADVEL
jgi:hypothetical protein